LTSNGTLPTACTASVWKSIPFSFAIAPISAIGCSTPISLLAAMIVMRIVLSVIASRRSSRSIAAVLLHRQVGHPRPCFSSFLHVSMTALCSVTQ
jgi:hypothetical protein